MSGHEDIDAALGPKKRVSPKETPGRIKIVVHIDNEYSDRFSILEIISQNSWGLLYRISRVISQHHCDIELVLASTEGSRAVDVFHLTKDGSKLSQKDSDRLKIELEEILKNGQKHA